MAKISNVTISPTFEFYSKLLYLLHGSGCFSYVIAKNLVNIKLRNPNLINLDVNLELLEQWFNRAANGGQSGERLIKYLATKCLSDLSGERKDGDIRNLSNQWLSAADFSKDLINHFNRKDNRRVAVVNG